MALLCYCGKVQTILKWSSVCRSFQKIASISLFVMWCDKVMRLLKAFTQLCCNSKEIEAINSQTTYFILITIVVIVYCSFEERACAKFHYNFVDTTLKFVYPIEAGGTEKPSKIC